MAQAECRRVLALERARVLDLYAMDRALRAIQEALAAFPRPYSKKLEEAAMELANRLTSHWEGEA